MHLRERFFQIARQLTREKLVSIKAKLCKAASFHVTASSQPQRRRPDLTPSPETLQLLTGAHAPPNVLKSGAEIYVAYRPD